MSGVTRPGALVAFEGLDGCGKSTQITRLAARLRRDDPGREVLVLREPGSTPLGESVRGLLLDGDAIGARAEMLLYMAARAELYERTVLPALDRGATVLLDRSHYSTLAYQGHGLGLDVDVILATARFAIGGRDPDRVVLVEVDVDTAAARLAGGAAPDRIERRGREYFERVAAGFGELARRDPGRFVVVDGTAPADDVTRAVDEALADVV